VRMNCALFACSLACALSLALVQGQTVAEPKPVLAEDVFKNVQVLKGITVNRFMETMGLFSAALGMSCEDCHTSSDTGWQAYAADTNPRKRTARRMITMMATINRTSFAGRQLITCYTCHRGSDRPIVTPNLSTLYMEKIVDPPDIVAPFPNAPSIDLVLDTFIRALGGADRLARLTSFVATGTSAGYGPESEPRKFEVFARASGERTTITHTLDGDSTTAFDGSSGWTAAPHRPVPVLALTGQDLDGVKLDAQLSFPARIKSALSAWRVGPSDTIADRDVQVVQGTTQGGVVATLYFDKETGLLVRQVRYAESPVGRIPTQIDYADYREVAGVKMPFRLTVVWLDGQDTIQLTAVQPNVAIDPAMFRKPAAPSP